MLLMSAGGASIATFVAPNAGNAMAGLLTFYLVLTAWVTVWRRPAHTGALEVGAAVLGLATIIAGGLWARTAATAPTHRLNGYPPALFLAFGSIALLATCLDLRMIFRGGLQGAARITRHLWRMCVAMLIATSSFFLGLASRRFPAVVRDSGLTVIPVLLVVVALVYWLLRIRILPALRTRRPGNLATH
jgi:hypothetical protein